MVNLLTPIFALALGLFAVPGAWGGPLPSPVDDPFGDCQRQVEAEPNRYEPYLCFHRVARRAPEGQPLWDSARHRLETLERANPDLGWPTLVLGFLAVAGSHDTSQAFELFGRAQQHFERRHGEPGAAHGQVLAHSNLRRLLLREGRMDEALEHVIQARRAAEASRDPLALARALTLTSAHRMDTGGDLGRAYLDLERSSHLMPDPPYGLQRSTLLLLGNVATGLGRFGDALDAYTRLETLMEERGETRGAAVLAFNIANAALGRLEKHPDPKRLGEIEHLARRALQLTLEDGQRPLIARSHAILAEVLGTRHPEEARNHVEACLEFAGLDASVEAACRWPQTRLLLAEDPQAALEASERALDLAREPQNVLFVTFARRAQIRAAWRALDRSGAWALSQEALADIETLREAETDPGSRAEIFAFWAADLAWLVGRLLEGDSPDLHRAFDVLERQRARVLLESTAPRAQEAPSPDRDALERRIASIQRPLLDPDLEPGRRLELLTALEGLELEERLLLARDTTEGNPTAAAANLLTTLAQVEQSLGTEEAMLSFQIDPWTDLFGEPAGGAWVMVTTHQGSSVVPIEAPLALDSAVPVFLGLLERRDGGESEVAVKLHQTLLAKALDSLPPGIERLILIPDGVLHHLPFAALRPSVDAPSLGEHFELVHVPSATLWQRWRREPTPTTPRTVLTFADPALWHSVSNDAVATERHAILVQGLTLGRLPQARREGRDVQRRLGGILLSGEEATEKRLSELDLSQYGVLHFATHAVLDSERPERSCLVLAPGDPAEDGLLRVREAAALPLDGQLVVLSACQTTGGKVLRGEGIQSLAQAFLTAGAYGVIGSRWPLRDDEGAYLLERFYRSLAEGESASHALRQARRDAVAEGLPARAWAGVVLLGSDAAPHLAAPKRFPWPWVLAGLVLGTASAVALRKRP